MLKNETAVQKDLERAFYDSAEDARFSVHYGKPWAARDAQSAQKNYTLWNNSLKTK